MSASSGWLSSRAVAARVAFPPLPRLRGASTTSAPAARATSADQLRGLVEAVERGEGDLAVAVFARRVGGGFGLALGAARRVIQARTGLKPVAPISGQRAMRVGVLRRLVPFAHGFGMETAMTIDAHRAGYRLVEVELDLEHRATGRTAAGFAHRGRQLADILRVWFSRR